MGRAERRRQERASIKSKTKTYNFTKEQLEGEVRKYVELELAEIRQQVTEEAINTAMLLMLTLPMQVLINHYWQRSFPHRLPKFTDLLLDYYRKWQDGELDMDKLKADLWEFGGVKLYEKEESE